MNFDNPKYVGDPINAVKIFNEKEADELIVLDIDATREKRPPNFELIKKLAVECRMPFCYGGGVTTVEQAKRIINLGVEKVAISSAGIADLNLLKDIGNTIGVQSVVLVLDVAKRELLGDYELYLENGRKRTNIKLKDFLKNLSDIHLGELVINSIDRDGTLKGYDYKLLDMVRESVDVPLTVIGGAGDLKDIKELISRYKIIGAAAGSLFVFKGRYKAVLINYPEKEEKQTLYIS
jgi:cyclase